MFEQKRTGGDETVITTEQSNQTTSVAYSRDERAAIHLTQSAADAVRTAMAGAAEPMNGLRIVVEAGGCAGFKYMMGLVAEPSPGDLMVEDRGVKVFIEPSSLPSINGTTIDFVVNLQESGFSFNNPQANNSCSCGKSFG
jgi:iron-sulfur cluster assembly protein